VSKQYSSLLPLILFSLFFFPGCFEDPHQDFFSVSYDGGPHVFYEEQESASARWGYDPFLLAEFDNFLVESGGTELWLMRGYSVQTEAWDELLLLFTLGASHSSFTMERGEMIVLYANRFQGIFGGEAGIAGVSGTVYYSTYGMTGDLVSGQYTVTLCDMSTLTPDCGRGVIMLSGGFELTREPNGYGQSGPGLRENPLRSGLLRGLAEGMTGRQDP